MYRRNILKRLNSALADTRVVLLNGARQVGKGTLAQELARKRGGQRCRSTAAICVRRRPMRTTARKAKKRVDELENSGH